MLADPPNHASVLIVEDNEPLAENYEYWLSRHYDTTVVTDGERALESITDETDVVFLDRRLPGRSGDEILGSIRCRDLDVRVVMVTGVTPDFDILDMGFDDYLVKPVDGDELVVTVDRMLARANFGEATREYYALSARKATLEAAKHDHELAASPEYARIEERIGNLRAEVDTAVDAFGPGDFRAAFHAIQTASED